MTTKCPDCGNAHLQVQIVQWADVLFDNEEDSHEVTDGPNGDLEWGTASDVICASNLGGCGWSGKLAECETEGEDE